MLNYLKAHPVNVALSALFILAFGVTTFFLASSNSDLRQENRGLKRENKESENLVKDYEDTIGKLLAHIEETERIDSIEAIKDSAAIQRIKNLDITTTNANRRTIINMPSDSFMLLLSSFIDSSGKATD